MRETISAAVTSQFAEDIRAGLDRADQKQIPSKYLYDDVGSALFEAISALPEYGLTRADERILRRHASEMVARISSPVIVAELGSGTGKKTRWILEELCRRQPTRYYPIDVSASSLAVCERELESIDSVSIIGLEREYLDGLLEMAARRNASQRLLVLFLGSTIGNFESVAGTVFLTKVRGVLRPGDALLLGTDLEKPIPQLLAAYDDPLGVTAAFNLNLLARANRELGADFALRQFEHVVRFNPATRSIEMYLRSRQRQTVNFSQSGFSVMFDEDEAILTEISHKFSPEEVLKMARVAGFHSEAQWIDPEWPFAETLLLAE